ncbi:MAG: hypothetical protein GY765_04875, partial [bacterium]|nr:hypothetical protein [bacterium]
YPTDISEAECMQRAGRAGRVRNGQYILCADAGIKERPPFPDPEIQLVNLDSVILRLIKMGIQPLEFPFFHAPSKALVFKGIKQLKLLGATDEEGRVTEDGKKMAEFPVSLRSARMLMEAQKGNANVIDAAVKCIAILETKGIASKEALGEVYHNAPYRSDLLNQLALWNSHKQYRKSLNWKKFSQAGDIHKELNKRLGLTARVKGGLSTKDMPILYRSLLSCFADEIHFKGGNEYQRDNEVRQLDRSSVLYENKPEMVAGIPFDLVITRENYDTGEKEDAFIPLITFASELTLELLEELKPFSYYKEERITIEKKVVAVFREHYFGGKLISAVSTSPRKQDMEEKKRVVAAVIEWFDHHGADFALAGKMKVLETQFNEASSVVKRKLKPFSTYWRDFLYRELMEHLDIDTLDLFFKFHSGFSIITLKNILPGGVIKELKQAYWPRKIALHDVPPLTRQDAKDDRGTKKPPKQKTSGKEPPVEKKEKGAGDLDKKPPEMPRREGINKARHAGTDKARQEAKDMPRQVAKEISQKVAMDNSQQNTTAPLSVENTLPLKGAPVVTESHYVGRVYYIRRKPFLKFSYSLLEKVKEQHLILPTGEIAGVLLDGRKYFRWQHVENEYNRWKKKNIFDKKYRDLKKDGYMDDLQEIPFPQTFEAGKGLDNKPFEFYTVPTIEQGKVFLVHYFHKEDAESYFEELRPQWETFVRNYKKSKIDNIFKQKGWTVR